MHIERLETRNFRNLVPDSVELPAGGVVLRGDNGQGKTNFLEALYICATGKSFRQAPNKELVCHAQEQAKIVAQFSRQGVRHDIEIELRTGYKGIRLDGRSLRKTSSLLELLNVVAFFPDDLRIVKGSPEERRRFLDRAVANHHPSFVDTAQAYAKVLKERNALLKSAQGGALDTTLLAVYDEQLSEHGTRVHCERLSTLQSLSPLAEENFAAVMQEGLQLGLALESGFTALPQSSSASFSPDPTTIAEVGGASEVGSVLLEEDPFRPPDRPRLQQQFRAALAASQQRDRMRGTTGVGPHRADMLTTINGRSARAFASQGQQRAIVLALKLAEVVRLKRVMGSPPILLLDDVSSELDRQRTMLLFAEIEKAGGQVLISTTGAASLPLPAAAQIFEVVDGKLSKATT